MLLWEVLPSFRHPLGAVLSGEMTDSEYNDRYHNDDSDPFQDRDSGVAGRVRAAASILAAIRAAIIDWLPWAKVLVGIIVASGVVIAVIG